MSLISEEKEYVLQVIKSLGIKDENDLKTIDHLLNCLLFNASIVYVDTYEKIKKQLEQELKN
jgi:hypothetical protein